MITKGIKKLLLVGALAVLGLQNVTPCYGKAKLEETFVSTTKDVLKNIAALNIDEILQQQQQQQQQQKYFFTEKAKKIWTDINTIQAQSPYLAEVLAQVMFVKVIAYFMHNFVVVNFTAEFIGKEIKQAKAAFNKEIKTESIAALMNAEVKKNILLINDITKAETKITFTYSDKKYDVDYAAIKLEPLCENIAGSFASAFNLAVSTVKTLNTQSISYEQMKLLKVIHNKQQISFEEYMTDLIDDAIANMNKNLDKEVEDYIKEAKETIDTTTDKAQKTNTGIKTAIKTKMKTVFTNIWNFATTKNTVKVELTQTQINSMIE
jgi:hypothetical protein